jgi:Na+/H+-dicarboxylate symporter
MQVYTKIMIGMGVGAVIGLTLGPNSILLDKNAYRINDPSAIDLCTERANLATRVELPSSRGVVARSSPVSMLFEVLAIEFEERSDALGISHTVPTWAQVRFELKRAIAIRDRDQSIRKALGGAKVGDRVEAWLRIENIPVESGGFTSYPERISALGDTVITWLSPVGKLFLRLIMMVIVPLVFASLLVGVASLGDVRKLGRLGGKTILLYLGTTALAVTIGLIVAHIINPGQFMDAASKARLQADFQGAAGAKLDEAAAAPSLIDSVLAIVPKNPVESLASANMLQIIFFALIFGIALTLLPDKQGQPVIRFFDRVQQAMVIVIHMVMAVAPYGVAALIAEVVGTSGLSVLTSLVVYAVAVLVGLALHISIVYVSLLRFVVHVPLFDFLRCARPAQLIAFSTSSSSAALPVTMQCAEENLGVSKSISSFVLPLGSTVNMDGTALYQGVAALFIAQVFQMELGLAAQVGIVLTATMASIGAAGVPGAGMVTLALVLTALGIPPVGVALILGLDRLLDMFRTMVNVTGDLTVTAVMAISEGEKLQPQARAQQAIDDVNA